METTRHGLNSDEVEQPGVAAGNVASEPVGRRVLCYAHRGARAYLPENTLPAFALALDLGADGIECDVQRTRDGQLVIIHDATLDRTTNGRGLVAATPFDELRRLDAGVRKRIPAQVPTLGETLALIRERRALLNLEIKGESIAEAVNTAQEVEPVLRALDDDPDDDMRERVLVSSFELPAVRLLKEHLPWLRIAALFGGSRDARQDRTGEMLDAALAMAAEAIHPGLGLVTPELIQRAHEAGLRVNLWTANLVSSMRQLIAWDADGIFSDFPERVVIARARMAARERSDETVEACLDRFPPSRRPRYPRSPGAP